MLVVPHRCTPLSRATGQVHYHERHLALLGGETGGLAVRKSGSIGTKTNDRMWVHLNKEPAGSGGAPIDAEGMSPQKRVPLRQDPPTDRPWI